MNLKGLLALALLAGTFSGYAAAPSGYYNSCENKSGRNLLQALNGVISNHTTLSYKSLNDYYPKTDAYPDGTLWDIYSTKHWNPSAKCGNYSVVGDCYNKEHSFPKSWFDDASPMYSDLHHLYPTDGKVNGQRSNHPYGECSRGTTLPGTGSVKALGRLGSSTFSGYSGTVFEPDDEYKGDLARTYFYMAACYYTRTASWHSDMLAGNNFPLFKTWAINLLLKWHRQDPVSSRETKRNDAVAKVQGNRNPFIDHPELAEHIWGDKTSTPWTASGLLEIMINQPVAGSTVDMGKSAPGIKVERTVQVKTTNASDAVTLTATAPFSVVPGSISATSANAGTTATLVYTPAATGSHTGTLTVATGTKKSIVNLKGTAVDGLPADEATEISSESFVAHWTYVGDADAQGYYSLYVTDDAGVLEGYPVKVNAQAGSYTVAHLNDLTDYEYYLKSQTLTSNTVKVRTAEAMPLVEFLFDGDLYFSTAPGEPSEEAEILVSIENITDNVEVSVKAPFELSLDRSEWSQTVTMSPDESRLYMRLNSAEAGSFETSIAARAGSYFNDGAVVSGTVSATPTFFEDFEPTGKYDTYDNQTYLGSAATWNLEDTGIWPSDKAYAGEQALRGGRNCRAVIAMAAPRQGGIGTVTFWAQRWTATEDLPVLVIETSTDEGKTWSIKGTVEIADANWKEYTVTANVAGNAMMRLRETSGKRFMLDNITISDRTAGCDDPAAERHLWDAYSRNGVLTVTVMTDSIDAEVYAVDGRTLYTGSLLEGTHNIDGLAVGTVVIVHSGDFSRTVLIR